MSCELYCIQTLSEKTLRNMALRRTKLSGMQRELISLSSGELYISFRESHTVLKSLNPTDSVQKMNLLS
jgi:hypothetical protein